MMERPDRLGKYEILEELGRGAFAAVYRARDTTLNREVALKVLHPQLLVSPEWVARFRREAQAMAGLRHPHIVTIHEVAEAEGRLYIVMELARGPHLGRRIAEQGRLSWSEALAILEPVAAALDYAHAQGIVHRDLKPANILVDPERGPLVSDFGFARLVGDSSISLSLSGGILGTPAYIAPEVWEQNRAAAPADLYALGAIVYEMLTGKVLFGGETPLQAMRAHDRGPEFPSEWPEGVPAGVAAVLAQALARDPAARHPSTGALYQALAGLAAQAQAAREAAERARVAAEWRAAAEESLAAGEWSAARMALGRWLTAAPDDPAARAFQGRLEERERGALTPTPLPPSSSPALRERGRGVAEGRGEGVRARPTPPPTPPPAARRRVPARGEGGRAFPPWAWLSVALLSLALVVVLALVAAGVFSPRGPTPQPTSTPTPTTGPALGSTQTRPVDGMVMVYVPAGDFLMGSSDADPEAFNDEKPQHTVYLEGYWIDRTEVTNAQYRRCVEAGACQAPTTCDWGDPTYGDASKQDHPVVCVDWQGARDYCAWVGGALPSEAQWEKAARGTDGRKYPWGNEFECSRGNFDDETEIDFYVVPGGAGCDGYNRTAPVGRFPRGASPYGALDMAGNVWEWCLDWYDGGYYARSPKQDPRGPESGEYRVVRGGSWLYGGPWWVRAANRNWDGPASRDDALGFRCVVPARGTP